MQQMMRTLVGGIVWAAVLTCLGCAESPLSARADQSLAQIKSQEDPALQMDGIPIEQQMVKRGWRNLHQGGWGKRAWHNLQSAGWGKRPDPYSWNSLPAADKRSWQKFQGGWGKRWMPEEDWTSDSDNDGQQYDEYAQLPADFEDMLDEEKRTWRALTPSWGKRATSDWESFRGAWGKRDPAWNNLKGLWGKRSAQDRTPAS